MSEGAALIWCPFPDMASARTAASALLDERVIACANIVPGMISLFRWHGELSESAECGLLCKTSSQQHAIAMERLAALHPYDEPVVAGWGAQATAGTLTWLERETSPI